MKESLGAPNKSLADVNVFPLVKKIPRRLRGPVYAAATFLGVSGVAATCGGGDKSKVEPTSTQAGVASGQKTERFNPNAFLRMPMPRDPDAKVVQGWKYIVKINGTFNHYATDYIIGTSLGNSITWRKFPVLAAADGVACQSEYPATKDHPAGNQIQVFHPNKYTTFYIHNDPASLTGRLHKLPDCNKTPKSDWLPVEQGAKLSDASDIGAVDGWKHLDFRVKDPTGQIVDPYDLYQTRTGYPSPNFDDGVACGDNTLWINCPTGGVSNRKHETMPTIELVPTLAPVPTIAKPEIPTVRLATATAVVPTVKPELSEGEKKRQEIEAKMQKAQQLTQQFIDLLKAGGEQNIQAAFNMQLPESQKNRFNAYSLATLDTLRICSDEMINGEMQNIRLNRRFMPDANKVLTEAEKLNKERGLVARDVYSYGVTFLLNDWNSAAGTRIGFQEYDPVNHEMVVGFEDVNDQMMITQPKLCTAIGGPLAKTVYQLNSGQ